MPAVSTVERALVPVDAVRGALLRRVGASRHLRVWLASRDRRTAVLLAAAVVAATVLATVAPVVVYLLSPIVLGLPHVASDVRHLVLRAGLSRRLTVGLFAWCAALVALQLATLLGATFTAGGRTELALAGAGVLAATVAARRSRGRTIALVAIFALLFALAWRDPLRARLVFCHAHNPLALVLWLALFRRRRGGLGVLWLPLALLAAATVLVLHGDTFAWIVAAGARQRLGVDLLAIADQIAPDLGAFGVSLTIAFVLWQSIHYSIWLHVVPSEAAGTRSFRQSWRALVADFGPVALVALAAGMLALAAFAAASLTRTRDLYLSLAGFHAYLELAALGALWGISAPAANPGSACAPGGRRRSR
jgi:hypothetical protein